MLDFNTGTDVDTEFAEITKSLSTPITVKTVNLTPNEIEKLASFNLSGKMWVFLMQVKASYENNINPKIDRDEFCKFWQIEPTDFDYMIAQLNKKKAIAIETPSIVQLELFPDNED